MQRRPSYQSKPLENLPDSQKRLIYLLYLMGHTKKEIVNLFKEIETAEITYETVRYWVNIGEEFYNQP